MIKCVRDTYTDKPNIREITFKYDNKNDEELLKKVKQFISDNQPICFNCQNYYREGSLGGYMASSCKLYGCLEAWNHPHHDYDGSKCDDYKRVG